MEELQAAFDNDTPESEAVLRSVSRIAGTLRGTRPFWADKRQDDMLSDDDAVEVIRLMAENAKLKDENRALQAKLDNMRGLLRAALGYMEA
ncbi:hypothetical protein ACJ73_03033 [Blastomyces percursus]|uniref:Uncharacterized protein n=1 Tax=Blastomyces percursus TaxID=1658174 RepID=A0A1J9RC80_9EURO|nr:hypothetical protein ACJ73_03033 [Blastomyces percursus]